MLKKRNTNPFSFFSWLVRLTRKRYLLGWSLFLLLLFGFGGLLIVLGTLLSWMISFLVFRFHLYLLTLLQCGSQTNKQNNGYQPLLLFCCSWASYFFRSVLIMDNMMCLREHAVLSLPAVCVWLAVGVSYTVQYCTYILFANPGMLRLHKREPGAQCRVLYFIVQSCTQYTYPRTLPAAMLQFQNLPNKQVL